MEFENDRYLTVKDLAERYRCTPSGLYKRVSLGRFPAGVKFGRSHLWLLSEVLAWERDNLPRAVPGGPSPRERARLKRLAQD